jgi:hypothetical protein
VVEDLVDAAEAAHNDATPEPLLGGRPKPRAREAGSAQGSVASSLRTTAHPLHTRSTNIFSASVAEATMRPNLLWTLKSF